MYKISNLSNFLGNDPIDFWYYMASVCSSDALKVSINPFHLPVDV